MVHYPLHRKVNKKREDRRENGQRKERKNDQKKIRKTEEGKTVRT
jgi:hypothetical protein